MKSPDHALSILKFALDEARKVAVDEFGYRDTKMGHVCFSPPTETIVSTLALPDHSRPSHIGARTKRHNKRVRKRLPQQILSGTSDASVRFDDLRTLLAGLGFAERIRGGHHVFSREGVIEILNLKPRHSMAKPYQVRQVRALIVRYKLAEGIE